MWLLKTTTSDQKATISKWLKDGFEPFAVIDAGFKNSRRIQRIYFRKNDLVMVALAEEAMTTPPVINLEFVEQLVDATFQLATKLEYSNVLLNRLIEEGRTTNDRLQMIADKGSEQKVSLWTPPFPTKKLLSEQLEQDIDVVDNVFSEEPRDSSTLILTDGEMKEAPKPTEEQLRELEEEQTVLRPEDFGVEREVPSGDSFRVVDDVPSASTLTATQESVIKQIAAKHQSEALTQMKMGNGSVKVYVEKSIYTIYPDGGWTHEDNEANTSSLTV